jgi:PKD repeat protein
MDAHHCSQIFNYPVGSNSPLHALFSLSGDTVYTGAQLQCINNSSGSGSYVWNFGDQTTDSTANPDHQFLTPGVFRIVLKAYDGICVDSSFHTVYVMSSGPTGLTKKGVTQNEVNVISSGENYFVEFKLTQESIAVISIFDSEGKRIENDLSVAAYQNSVALPFDHHLARGIYFISININGKITSRKILL